MVTTFAISKHHFRWFLLNYWNIHTKLQHKSQKNMTKLLVSKSVGLIYSRKRLGDPVTPLVSHACTQDVHSIGGRNWQWEYTLQLWQSFKLSPSGLHQNNAYKQNTKSNYEKLLQLHIVWKIVHAKYIMRQMRLYRAILLFLGGGWCCGCQALLNLK